MEYDDSLLMDVLTSSLDCLNGLGRLLGLPPGADLPTELPKAIQRLLNSLESMKHELNGSPW